MPLDNTDTARLGTNGRISSTESAEITWIEEKLEVVFIETVCSSWMSLDNSAGDRQIDA